MKRHFILYILLFIATGVYASVDSTGTAGDMSKHHKMNINDDINVKCFPNPFTEEINVVCENSIIKRIEIWNMKQKLMFAMTSEIMPNVQFTINTGDFEKGYYIVKIILENETKALVISK
jgi:hypothetical protein